MDERAQLWGIVLAAGEGRRLQALTVDHDGYSVPKQYCSFNGGSSLLRLALDRAASFTRTERVVVVVSADHRRWWEPETAHLPAANVVVQPCNRGTACGVLLPLFNVALRDAEALVAVLPSDHHVRDETVLLRALRGAVDAVRKDRSAVVLLGIAPDGPEVEYGWVRPALGRDGGVSRVLSFVEKPDRPFAEQLLSRGALWNSFIFVATAANLLDLFDRAMPEVTRSFSSALLAGQPTRLPPDLISLYDVLPTRDFARDVLQRLPDTLRVIPVPPCGWTDLGSPDRVARCVAEVASSLPAGSSPTQGRIPVDLARAVLGVQQPRPGGRFTTGG